MIKNDLQKLSYLVLLFSVLGVSSRVFGLSEMTSVAGQGCDDPGLITNNQARILERGNLRPERFLQEPKQHTQKKDKQKTGTAKKKKMGKKRQAKKPQVKKNNKKHGKQN